MGSYLEPDSLTRLSYNSLDRSGCERSPGSPDSEKDGPKLSSRTRLAEIGGNGFSDLLHKRQAIFSPPLPTDRHLTLAPVDIVKNEISDFERPKTQANHEKYDGIVASSYVLPAITTSEKSLYLIRGQSFRQSCQAAAGYGKRRYT